MSNNLHDNININYISIFLKLAQFSSLTEASKYLKTDKGRLSRILQELENSLGVTLIHRTTREFRVTAEGKRFFEQCGGPILKLEEAVNGIHKADQEFGGYVKMTAAHGVASSLLPKVLAAYQAINPKVKVEVSFSQNLVNVDHEVVDLALRLGNLKDSGLKIRKICDYEISFFGNNKFLNSISEVKSPEDLKKYQCFLLSHYNKKNITLKKGKLEKRIYLDGSVLSNCPDFIMDVTLKGEGIGLIPNVLCAAHINAGELKMLIPKWTAAAVPMNLVSPSGRKQPPHVKHFAEFMFNYLKELSFLK